MNRMIENYPGSFSSYHKNDEDELLAGAKIEHSSSVSGDLDLSPFEDDPGWNRK